MANDYKHHLHIKCSDEQKNLIIQSICRRDADNVLLFDFNLLIHQPSDLNCTNYGDAEGYCKYLASTGKKPEWDKEIIEFEYFGYKTILRNREDAKKMYENGLKYGYLSWYDWRRDMWGTKWNAYDAKLEEYGISYNTANGKALEPLVVLSARFPDVQFYVEWADEDMGYNCGKAILYDGNIQMLEQYDRRENGDDALRFACEVWNYDYNEYIREEN